MGTLLARSRKYNNRISNARVFSMYICGDTRRTAARFRLINFVVFPSPKPAVETSPVPVRAIGQFRICSVCLCLYTRTRYLCNFVFTRIRRVVRQYTYRCIVQLGPIACCHRANLEYLRNRRSFRKRRMDTSFKKFPEP